MSDLGITRPEGGVAPPATEVAPPATEDDIYAISAPMPAPVRPTTHVGRGEDIVSRYQRQALEEAPKPPATFLSGVFRFPWYLQSLAAWVFCSFGIAVSVLAVMLAIWLANTGLTMAAYAMRLSICWVIALAMAYLSGCLLAIIEGTSNGYDEITDWPAGDWREYLFSLAYPAGMLVPTALLAAAAFWLTRQQTWAVPVVVGFLVYPYFLLSAMENGTVLGIISKPILRTYVALWWGWGIFYAVSAMMFGGWAAWFAWSFPDEPVATAGVSGPILASILFIDARLLGRLAWWSQHVGANTDDEA